MKICPECNERPLKDTSCYTCVQCVNVRFNRLRREKYKKDNPPKYIPEERCLECKNYFTPHNFSRGLCSKMCSEKNKIRKANEDWKNKIYDDTPKPLTGKSDIVAYSFFRKKYCVKSKYKVCRG